MKPTSKEVIDELCKILNATPKEIKGFMTAKEKAHEIFEKMFNAEDPMGNYPMCFDTAKDCALVAVYMVIKCCEEYDEVHENHTTQVDYWKEVKQEIEKL